MLAQYYKRMPVIVEASDYSAWLGPDTERRVLQQAINRDADAIAVYPVSRFVNKPSNNDERCLNPA